MTVGPAGGDDHTTRGSRDRRPRRARRTPWLIGVAIGLAWLGLTSWFGALLAVPLAVVGGIAMIEARRAEYGEAAGKATWALTLAGLLGVQQLPFYLRGELLWTAIPLLTAITLLWMARRRLRAVLHLGVSRDPRSDGGA